MKLKIELGEKAQNRLLVQGDLYKPLTYSSKIKDVDGFNAIMVMHEFLRDGKEKVIQMFKDMKKEFKGKYFSNDLIVLKTKSIKMPFQTEYIFFYST